MLGTQCRLQGCGNRYGDLSLDAIKTARYGSVKTRVSEAVCDGSERQCHGQAAVLHGKMRRLRHESVNESGRRNRGRIYLSGCKTHSCKTDNNDDWEHESTHDTASFNFNSLYARHIGC